MTIYNIFPPLAGTFTDWRVHMSRARQMGFNWIFVNPVQMPGLSGSLYSIKDYFKINPVFVDQESSLPPEQQLSTAINDASQLGMRVMVDLVINHSAIDSPIVKEHPEWYMHDKKGRVAHPFAMDNGKKVVWGDLARFDHSGTSDPEGMYAFFKKITEHLISVGFKGFRCDAAYQVPQDLWKRLISEVKAAHPDVIFTAETLGCSGAQTRDTALAGFDYVFNSSKWWDYKSPWLLEQYNLTREASPSIGFPESHDTVRLAKEFKGNINALKMKYLFEALFSAGVMIMMGFEFGFHKRPHVVKTRPSDWEKERLNLCDFISEVNAFKESMKIFNEDAKTSFSTHKDNKNILIMRKQSEERNEAAMLALNLDAQDAQQFTTRDIHKLSHIASGAEQLWPSSDSMVRDSFQITLGPGEGLVLAGRLK